MKIGDYGFRIDGGEVLVTDWSGNNKYYRLTKANVLHYITLLENPRTMLLSRTIYGRAYLDDDTTCVNEFVVDIERRMLGCTKVSLQAAKLVLESL